MKIHTTALLFQSILLSCTLAQAPIIIKATNDEDKEISSLEFSDESLRSDVGIGTEEEIKEISPKKEPAAEEKDLSIEKPIAVGKVIDKEIKITKEEPKEETKEKTETKAEEKNTPQNSETNKLTNQTIVEISEKETEKNAEVKKEPKRERSGAKLTPEQRETINKLTNERFEKEKAAKYKEVAKEFQAKIDAIRATGRKLTEEEKKKFRKEFGTAKMKAGGDLKKNIRKEIQEEVLKKEQN
jgi:hypothetical protein